MESDRYGKLVGRLPSLKGKYRWQLDGSLVGSLPNLRAGQTATYESSPVLSEGLCEFMAGLLHNVLRARAEAEGAQAGEGGTTISLDQLLKHTCGSHLLEDAICEGPGGLAALQAMVDASDDPVL